MAVTVYNTRPEEQAINSGWLIATVGAESITVLAAVVAPQWPAVSEAILFAAYLFWAVGILLNLIFIAIILHRFFITRSRRRTCSPVTGSIWAQRRSRPWPVPICPQTFRWRLF
ncbi:MAG: SLAC1 family transporter [Bacilli bacterium]